MVVVLGLVIWVAAVIAGWPSPLQQRSRLCGHDNARPASR